MNKELYEENREKQRCNSCKIYRIEQKKRALEDQNRKLEKEIIDSCNNLIIEYLDRFPYKFHGSMVDGKIYNTRYLNYHKLVYDKEVGCEMIRVFTESDRGGELHYEFSLPFYWVWDEKAKLARFAEKQAIIDAEKLKSEKRREQRRASIYLKLQKEFGNKSLEIVNE